MLLPLKIAKLQKNMGFNLKPVVNGAQLFPFIFSLHLPPTSATNNVTNAPSQLKASYMSCMIPLKTTADDIKWSDSRMILIDIFWPFVLQLAMN